MYTDTSLTTPMADGDYAYNYVDDDNFDWSLDTESGDLGSGTWGSCST
jgi:hypothetical protein